MDKKLNKQESQYLTSEEIVEFQKLVLETKGIDLTPDEAFDQGTRLIMLMETMQKFEPIQSSYKDIVEVSGQNG